MKVLEAGTGYVVVGDCRQALAGLDAGWVQTCVTSPPYFGLRNYGLGGQDWPDGWKGCLGLEPTPELYVEHLVEVFRGVKRVLRDDGVIFVNLGDSYASSPRGNKEPGGGNLTNSNIGSPVEDARWEGGKARDKSKIAGLKPKDLVGIPWRVAFALQADGWYLRSDNIWAKSCSGNYKGGSCMPQSVQDRTTTAHEYVFMLSKSKTYFYDHMAVRETSVEPARGARNDRFGGNKHNGETTKHSDQSTWKGHDDDPGRNLRDVWVINPQPSAYEFCLNCKTLFTGKDRSKIAKRKEGKRKILTCPVCQSEDKWVEHFAAYPPALISPCVKAGTPEVGSCAVCGTPWKRVTGRKCPSCGKLVPTQAKKCKACGHVPNWKAKRQENADQLSSWEHQGEGPRVPRKEGAMGSSKTVEEGWTTNCTCPIPPGQPTGASTGGDPSRNDGGTRVRAPKGAGGGNVLETKTQDTGTFDPACTHLPATVPAVVLDPFMGSGVTGLVAQSLGRAFVGIEAKEDYAELAVARIRQAAKEAK